MTLDLSTLSLFELVQLHKDVAHEIPLRIAVEKQRVVDDLKKMAADRGFNLQELLGNVPRTSKGARGPATAKFRSEDGKEWSGRGRKPTWVAEHIAKGGKLEDLAIQVEAPVGT